MEIGSYADGEVWLVSGTLKSNQESLVKEVYMNKIRGISIFVAFMVLLCTTISTAAEEKKKTVNTKRAETEDAVEVKMESTRPRLAVGTGLGITALVKNKSKSDIYLHEKYITILPSPELMGWSYIGVNWYGVFPTETHETASNGPDSYFEHEIKIPAGEQYLISWYVPTSEQETGQKRDEKSILSKIYHDIHAELRFLFFTPGKYSVSFVTKYWIDPETPPNGKYHTKVETEILSFDAPQSVILFGAGVGGLIAYFLLPQARRRLIASKSNPDEQSFIPNWMKNGIRETIGIFGAALLSAIVTILLARISESQFLIRVTVVDFWGAVAIGFIANYAGAEVLNKIIKIPEGKGKDSNGASKQTTTSSNDANNP